MNAFKWLTSLFTKQISDDEHYTSMQEHPDFEFSRSSSIGSALDGDSEMLTADHMTQCNTHSVINPASGLPMIGGVGGFDYAGNAFGVDGYKSDEFHVDLSTDSYRSTYGSDMFDNSGGMDSFNPWG